MLQGAVEQAAYAISKYLDRSSFVEGEGPLLRQRAISHILGIKSTSSFEEFRDCAIDTASSLFRVLEEAPPHDTSDPKKLKQHLSQLQLALEKFDNLISLTEERTNGDKIADDNLNLTDIEVAVLEMSRNLADGHAYRPWNEREAEIISKAGEIMGQVDRRQQSQIEDEYIRLFFQLGHQTYDPTKIGTFMCFNASSALEVIGNYLRLGHLDVSLVEPCFDNLADILKRHHVPMQVFQEEWYDSLDEHIHKISTDAIFLVTPNNPTGRYLDRENLEKLASYCKSNNKLLILDTCFRFYLPDQEVYDQYAVLLDSGVDFITVEDTGKTWPTLELKGPFMTASKGVSEQVGHINSDFLLHVSPFTVKFMSQFLQLSIDDNRASLHEVVATNRAKLYSDLEGTYLAPTELSFASIAWLKITNGLSAHTVRDNLERTGVHILAGHKFFWSDNSKGDSYIRISLVREPGMFGEATEIIHQVCKMRGTE